MYSKTEKTNVMKKIISYAVCLIMITSVAATPTSKVLQLFKETFPNATNIKWSDDKQGYFVSFTQNGNFEKVLYSKSGNFICSWKYSDGKELSTPIVMALKKNYKDCEIKGVTEFATDQNVSYEVKLANSKNWYSVKVSSEGKIISSDKFNNPAN
jgi:hypothetical protein